MKSVRILAATRVTALRLAGATTLLVLAIAMIFRPDPHDERRAAAQLFQQGSYYAALQIYARLSVNPADAEAALGLGVLRMVRGEYELAERAMRQAMERGLSPKHHDLALLYVGQALANRGLIETATRTWNLLEPCGPAEDCFYRSQQRLLVAEQALKREDYAVAEAGYRQALVGPLPDPWYDLAIFRLTLLGAARDQATALTDLAQLQAQRPATLPTEPLLDALLPRSVASLSQLVTVLNGELVSRDQALGQIYLDLGFYSLAEAQFAKIDTQGPDALAARAYAAYTRWLAGDRQGGLEQLEQLVTAYPGEPRAHTLLALAYTAEDQSEAARTQINAVSQISPASPNTRLAWASWYAAQHDDVRAAEEYRLASEQSSAADKGRYALLGANFHFSTAYDLCTAGLTLAEVAAQALAKDAAAQTSLAAHRYRCGDRAGAAAAARIALAIAPSSADAAYYLGAALAALGDTAQARNELVRAADLAPASLWRARAEEALALLR